MLSSTAPTPTAIPAPIPARIPPRGRENPRGAREYPTFLPKPRSHKTASQKNPITAAAANVSTRTVESKASCASAMRALDVDVFRGPSVAGVSQEPLLYGGRHELYLPQLLDAYPAHFREGRPGTRRDFRIAPQGRLTVSFQLHPHHDVDRMAPLLMELAHVEDSGEAGRKVCLLGELAARAPWYRLARFQPASRQDPVRVPARFLVAHQEQGPFSLHHRCDPYPEIHGRSCAVLAHAASIPGRELRDVCRFLFLVLRPVEVRDLGLQLFAGPKHQAQALVFGEMPVVHFQNSGFGGWVDARVTAMARESGEPFVLHSSELQDRVQVGGYRLVGRSSGRRRVE